MRTSLQYRIVAVLLAAASFMISREARADENPPKELLQYVQDAKRRGVPESRIREQAKSVGWSAALVDSAIAREAGRKPADGDGPAVAAASKAKPSSPSPSTVAPSIATPGRADGLPALPDDYLIGAGDALQISVWNEKDLTVPSVVVRPDGRITVPLIKEVEVGGLTPRQAEKLITEGLSKFITDPSITVVVAAINSKKVYLIGAVKKEGVLPYTYGLTVMQALSEASGLTDYAKRKKIYILRSEFGRDYRLEFNYEEVVRGERMEQNVVLLPGDTIVVPH